MEQGLTYQYTHAAQDCTPMLSPLSLTQDLAVVGGGSANGNQNGNQNGN